MRRFVQRCLLCQFANGNLKIKAPLTTREPVLPRESVFGDFIELVLANKRMYILVLVDYCTGWSMLIPTLTNDAYTVVDALLRKWIPLHGLFKYFDSDQGSGFVGNVTKLLIASLNADLQFAEPGYHRGIGKVERTIRIIQDNFQRINLQWDEVITDCKDGNRVFNILRVITPHIQAAINQRRPRISTFSPNMLMFGTQLKDISNIDIVIERMREIFCGNNPEKLNEAITKNNKLKNKNKNKNKISLQTTEFFDSSKYRTNPMVVDTVTTNNTKHNTQTNEQQPQNKWRQSWYYLKDYNKKKLKTKTEIKFKYDDYKYLEKLLQCFKQIYETYKTDWHKYLYQSKQQFNKKYNINEQTIERNNKIFTIGTQILYFIGNKQLKNRKWLRRFTGPWRIAVQLSDGTVIIEDPNTKIQKRVSINRIKLFNQSEVNNYSKIYNHEEYDEYTQQLKDILFKVGEKDSITQTSGTDLDYTKTRKSLIESKSDNPQIKLNNNKRNNKRKRNTKIKNKNNEIKTIKKKMKNKFKIKQK